jgi:hypothetical protein
MCGELATPLTDVKQTQPADEACSASALCTRTGQYSFTQLYYTCDATIARRRSFWKGMVTTLSLAAASIYLAQVIQKQQSSLNIENGRNDGFLADRMVTAFN